MSHSISKIIVTDLGLYSPFGTVGRWVNKVERQTTRHARQAAPSGLDSGRPNKSRANAAEPAGTLRASVRGQVTRIAPRGLAVEVSAEASYIAHVIHGTGTIFAKTARIPKGQPGAGQFAPLDGGGMYLPSQPFAKSRFRQRVRGQRANNFLAAAMERTGTTHPSIRGKFR